MQVNASSGATATLTAVTVLFAGCAAPSRPWEDVGRSPEERAALLLQAMTLDEKIAMTHGVCRLEMPGCVSRAIRQW